MAIVNGNENDNLLSGTVENDTIRGFDGDDVLNGLGGRDRLLGGDDDDRLNGGSGNDILFGEDDEDTLVGGSGNDILNGGDDSDTLTGGLGADTFRFALDDYDDDDDDADLITDFLKGTDKLAIQGFTWGVTGISYSSDNKTVFFDFPDDDDDFSLKFSSAIAPLSQSDFVAF